jgi:hypothetical protein
LLRSRDGAGDGARRGLRAAVRELARAKLPDLAPEEDAALRVLDAEATLLALIGALARAATSTEARAALSAAVTPR